ncbi:MAG: DUF268 domain-containing protein [Betaproteobacteria bacterium]|nr:DUF268 domain-containing protein [Betaproteobacteria bacterium]
MPGVIQCLKTRVKRTPWLKRVVLVSMRMLDALSWKLRLDSLVRYAGFFRDWRRFRHAGGTAAVLDFYPCLFDNTASTRIDSQYFHQAVWAFGLIRQSGAAQHVDIASEASFVGVLTTITRVVFVDIRPLFLRIPNYLGVGASATSLPFAAASVPSLSCLHVIEHIGLDRYGDPIDPAGPEKACAEIVRVLAEGGNAFVSLPIGRPRVSFNAHRVFSATEVLALFTGLQLHRMALVDATGEFQPEALPHSVDIRDSAGGLDYGLGLFWFTKPAKQ